MVIEHVCMFKLCSVTIADTLKWVSHWDIVVRKANKPLYASCQMKCGVNDQEFMYVQYVYNFGFVLVICLGSGQIQCC